MDKEKVVEELERKANTYLAAAKEKALEALIGNEDDRSDDEAEAKRNYTKHRVMLEAIAVVEYHVKK